MVTVFESVNPKEVQEKLVSMFKDKKHGRLVIYRKKPLKDCKRKTAMYRYVYNGITLFQICQTPTGWVGEVRQEYV